MGKKKPVNCGMLKIEEVALMDLDDLFATWGQLMYTRGRMETNETTDEKEYSKVLLDLTTVSDEWKKRRMETDNGQ